MNNWVIYSLLDDCPVIWISDLDSDDDYDVYVVLPQEN